MEPTASTHLLNCKREVDYVCNGVSLDHTVVDGTNCFDLSVQYDVYPADIYNTSNGFTCEQNYGDPLQPGDLLRICDTNAPPDNYVCNGVSLGDHTVVDGTNCYDLSVQYDVNYGDIYNTRNALTCSQDLLLRPGDLLRICDTNAVAATISE
jgi:hypothetical protein